jgi:hypothetical protein
MFTVTSLIAIPIFNCFSINLNSLLLGQVTLPIVSYLQVEVHPNTSILLTINPIHLVKHSPSSIGYFPHFAEHSLVTVGYSTNRIGIPAEPIGDSLHQAKYSFLPREYSPLLTAIPVSSIRYSLYLTDYSFVSGRTFPTPNGIFGNDSRNSDNSNWIITEPMTPNS